MKSTLHKLIYIFFLFCIRSDFLTIRNIIIAIEKLIYFIFLKVVYIYIYIYTAKKLQRQISKFER